MRRAEYGPGFDPGNIALVDLWIRAEARLERRAAALAVHWPKILAETSAGWAPEVDQAAIRFFRRFEKVRAKILTASHDQAQELARECCGPEFWLISATVEGLSPETFDPNILSCGYAINTYNAAQEIINEITAARAARKAIRWAEQSGILQEAVNYE